MWSITIGVVGVLATWVAVISLEGKVPDWRAQHYWFLGLVGLFPGWLVAFLSILQPVTKAATDVPLPPRAILSSGAALAGIIVTDYLLRRFQKSGRAFPPVTYWIIGWIALVPAWLIAMVNFK